VGKLKKSFWLVPAGLAMILIGCKPPSSSDSESADDGSPSSKVIAFQGTADPALVGTWVSKAGDSIFELGKDGSLKMTALRQIPGTKEPQKLTRNGSWAVNGKEFYTKSNDAGGETVAKYEYEQKGNTLDLSISKMKIKTELHRK
jgi:hypothetical protein